MPEQIVVRPWTLHHGAVGREMQRHAVVALHAAVQGGMRGIDATVDHRDSHAGAGGLTPGPLGCDGLQRRVWNHPHMAN